MIDPLIFIHRKSLCPFSRISREKTRKNLRTDFYQHRDTGWHKTTHRATITKSSPFSVHPKVQRSLMNWQSVSQSNSSLFLFLSPIYRLCLHTRMHTYVLCSIGTHEVKKSRNREKGTLGRYAHANTDKSCQPQPAREQSRIFPARICEYLPVGSALHARCNAL